MLPEGLRSLPYLVHTNRELGLMLCGVKPMAMFGYTDGHELDFVMRYLRMFDRHVEDGRIEKQHETMPFGEILGRYHHSIFYTLPGEGWRIGAMLNLLSRKGVWSNERERRYGELLGYEDWQNNIWLSRHPVIKDNG